MSGGSVSRRVVRGRSRLRRTPSTKKRSSTRRPSAKRCARAVKRSGAARQGSAPSRSAATRRSPRSSRCRAPCARASSKSQVEMQADQYIPFPMEEVSFDFEVLGPSEKDPDMLDVLLVATRSENVEQRAGRGARPPGLTAKIVDVEAFALENACKLLTHQMPDGGMEPHDRGRRLRREQHHVQRAAQSQGHLHARFRLRRPAAHRRNHAHLRPVAWKKPAAPRKKAACRATTRPKCSIRSSTT